MRIAVLMLLVFSSGAIAQSPQDREHAFTQWVNTPRMKFLGKYKDRLKALGLATKEAIPLFAAHIEDKEVKVRRAATLGLRLTATDDPDAAIRALTRAAKDSDLRVRGTAIAGLGDIGPPAATAVPVIVAVLEHDERNAYIAARALAKLGVKALPAVDSLARALNHNNELTRASAAHALGAIGPDARSAAPALRAAWRDHDAEVRLDAAYGLWKIDNSHDAINVLIALLESDDSRIVLRATEALGHIGHPAETALQDLEKVQQGNDELNGVAAVWAIGKIRGTENLVDKLIAELDNRNAMARVGAAWALGQIGPDARIAVPKLEELLRRDPVQYGYGVFYITQALSEIQVDSRTSDAPQ